MTRSKSSLAAISWLLVASGPLGAQALRVRASVKVILDAEGHRQSSTFMEQDVQIEEQFQFANEILRVNGASWRFVLAEIIDLPGVSQWFGPFDHDVVDVFSVKSELEQAAKSNPDLYQWRSDSINFYMIGIDYGGICSLPGGDEIIVVSTTIGNDANPNDPRCRYPLENAPWFFGGQLWLHETGHFFNLCHTHSCNYDDIPCNILPGTDDVNDTLSDHPCWHQDEIAKNNFGKSYAELTREQQRQVDVVSHNVMSYHTCELLQDRKMLLSPGQLSRMAAELKGRRSKVVYQTCEVGTIPGEEEADCNANGILDSCEADCNLNGIPDDCDLVGGSSRDENSNGVPDECDPPPRPSFHRGDPNSSGTSDISDGIVIFGFLFLCNPPTLSCKESADVNNDGNIDISDGVFLLSWLFNGGQEPAIPGPTGSPCGLDPDPSGSRSDLGCEAYSGCATSN